MKNLKSLNLGKSLNRAEMKAIMAGKANDPYCSCGNLPGALTRCGCETFCNGDCPVVSY